MEQPRESTQLQDYLVLGWRLEKYDNSDPSQHHIIAPDGSVFRVLELNRNCCQNCEDFFADNPDCEPKDGQYACLCGDNTQQLRRQAELFLKLMKE